MRPVLLSDVCAVARALLAVPTDERDHLCQEIFTQADHADRYRKHLRKAHPIWGNGTLLAAARAYPLAREPTFDDPDYCRVFNVVLCRLLVRKERNL